MLTRGIRRLGPVGGVGRRPARARLYTKEDCGLCREALALLRPFERRGRVAIEAVDITSDPDLFRQYCFTIPVLEIEGGPTLGWPFDRGELRRALG